MLELGSGGGNNASHLKARFQMTLVEPSPGCWTVSRALNPECEHVQGDMRTVRLGREFDAVFVHDAVCYMTTESDLRQAIETAFVHCRPGGAVLFAPDHVRENFQPVDRSWRPRRRRRATCATWNGPGILIRQTRRTWWTTPICCASATARAGRHDRHLEGLFPRADWLRLLSEAGFDPQVVPSSTPSSSPARTRCSLRRRELDGGS